MTMCVGFACVDGIVLVADRRMTARNYTYPEKKLQTIGWKNGTGIWGYSGDRDRAIDIDTELRRYFRLDVQIDRDQVLPTLKAALGVIPFKKKEFFSILFGAWTKGEERILLHSNGTDVRPVGVCEIIGYGDSALSRYLRGLVLRSPTGLSIRQALAAGVYIVAQESKYEGEGVGSGIDVCTLDGDHSVKVLAPEHTREWEKEFDLIETWLVYLFKFSTDMVIFPRTVPERIEEFTSRLLPFCEKVRGIH